MSVTSPTNIRPLTKDIISSVGLGLIAGGVISTLLVWGLPHGQQSTLSIMSKVAYHAINIGILLRLIGWVNPSFLRHFPLGKYK